MTAAELPTAALFARLDEHRQGREAAALELHARRAEYAVLDTYDELRHAAGHDYGAGQRRAELIRRRHELRRLEASAAPAPALEGRHAAAAAERLLRPRLRRLDREDYRAATPATRRTRAALEQTLAHYAPGALR